MEALKNKVEAIVNYFGHEDFINNYAEFLLQDRDDAAHRIKELINIKNYEVNKFYKGELEFCDDNKAQEIIDYIIENVEEFTTTFSSCYVGYTSIDSVSFGEQHEDLKEDVEKYGKEAVREAYEEASFYVGDDVRNASYDISMDGVHIDLLAAEIPVMTDMVKTEDKERMERFRAAVKKRAEEIVLLDADTVFNKLNTLHLYRHGALLDLTFKGAIEEIAAAELLDLDFIDNINLMEYLKEINY